jgi:hypothetical protein
LPRRGWQAPGSWFLWSGAFSHLAAEPRRRCLPTINGRSRWDLHTHTLPADNGLLFCSASRSEMVGSAGNAPVRRFRLCLRHPIYSRAAGSLP